MWWVVVLIVAIAFFAIAWSDHRDKPREAAFVAALAGLAANLGLAEDERGFAGIVGGRRVRMRRYRSDALNDVGDVYARAAGDEPPLRAQVTLCVQLHSAPAPLALGVASPLLADRMRTGDEEFERRFAVRDDGPGPLLWLDARRRALLTTQRPAYLIWIAEETLIVDIGSISDDPDARIDEVFSLAEQLDAA